MKTLKKLLIGVSLFSLSAGAFAQDSTGGTAYYFDLAKASAALGGSFNLSDADDYWYEDKNFTKSIAAPTDFSNPENSYYFDKSGSYTAGTITISDSIVNAKVWALGGRISPLSNNDTIATFKFANDAQVNIGTLEKYQAYQFKIHGGNINIGNVDSKVNGGIFFGESTTPLNSLTVTGTLCSDGHTGLGYPTTIFAAGGHSVKVNVAYGSEKNSIEMGRIVVGRSNNFTGGEPIMSFNAVTGRAGFCTAGEWGTVTILLSTNVTNSEITTASTEGMLWQGAFNSNTKEYGIDANRKLAITMQSGEYDSSNNFIYYNHTQEFTGDRLYWSGGVKMVSGTLLMNYKAAYQGDETYNNHGTLTFSKAVAAEATTFGSCGETVGGSFAFSDIVVERDGGSIRVRLNTDESNNLIFDALTLTGADGVVGKVTGTGTITLLFADPLGSDDATAYFQHLVRTADSDKSTWTKLISWQEKADETVKFDTEGQIWEFEGVEYAFQTFNGDDGLYVAYVAVPEPSTYAAIFGALALGFALYRRRK